MMKIKLTTIIRFKLRLETFPKPKRKEKKSEKWNITIFRNKQNEYFSGCLIIIFFGSNANTNVMYMKIVE